MDSMQRTKNMKPERMRSMIVIALLLLLLDISFVTSLGVSPASKTIYFQLNSTTELMFDIINSEQNAFEASLSAVGELKEIIFFENQVVNVNSTAYRTPFKAIVKFSGSIEPSIHTTILKIIHNIAALER